MRKRASGGSLGRSSSTVSEEGPEVAGLRWWREHFGSSKTISWPIFLDYFQDHCQEQALRDPSWTIPLEQMLKYTLDRSPSNREQNVITFDEWEIFLYRFGPLDACIAKVQRSFFLPTGEMVPWFHGSISRQSAKALLTDGSLGSFLIRFSETSPHNFTLTYLDQHDRQIKHVLIYNLGVRGFSPTRPSTRGSVCHSSSSSLISDLASEASTHLEDESNNGAEHIFPTLRDLIEYRQGWTQPLPSPLAKQHADDMAAMPRVATGVMGMPTVASIPGYMDGLGGADVAQVEDSDTESTDESGAVYSAKSTDYTNSAGSSPCGSPRSLSGAMAPTVPNDDFTLGGEVLSKHEELPLPPPVSAPVIQPMLREGSLPECAALLDRAKTCMGAGKNAEALAMLDEVLSAVRATVKLKQSVSGHAAAGGGGGGSSTSSFASTAAAAGGGGGGSGVAEHSFLSTASSSASKQEEGWLGANESCEELELWARAARVKATVLQMTGRIDAACEWLEQCAEAGRQLLTKAPITTRLEEYFPLLHEVHQLLADNFYQVGDCSRFLYQLEQCIAFTDDLQVRRLILNMLEKARDDDLYEDVPAPVVEAELEEAIAMYKEGELETARARFLWVMTHARFLSDLSTPEDLRLEARALGNCATVNHKLGRYAEAIFLYRMSLWLFDKMRDIQMERRMMNSLSLCCIEAGRLHDAYEICKSLLSMTERQDNRAFILSRLQEVASRLGLPPEDYEAEELPPPPSL